MLREIVGFQLDSEEEGQWLAKLSCHHFRHIRHNPPWQLRPWTQSQEGRSSMLGKYLTCVKCDEGKDTEW